MNLFIDIETFGNKPEEKEFILPTKDDVKLGNLKDSDKIEAKIKEQLPILIEEAKLKHADEFDKEWRGNALKSLSCNVVAISYAFDDADIIGIYNENEEALIGEFNSVLKENKHQSISSVIIGHNIKTFDIPILRHRAIKYGLRTLYTTITDKRYSDRIQDTMEIFRGDDYKSFYSLDGIAKYLGIGGKGDIKGHMVHDMYLDGKIKDISTYCSHDVEVLRNVYNKLTFK